MTVREEPFLNPNAGYLNSDIISTGELFSSYFPGETPYWPSKTAVRRQMLIFTSESFVICHRVLSMEVGKRQGSSIHTYFTCISDIHRSTISCYARNMKGPLPQPYWMLE
jgi:hypothetical protein